MLAVLKLMVCVEMPNTVCMCVFPCVCVCVCMCVQCMCMFVCVCVCYAFYSACIPQCYKSPLSNSSRCEKEWPTKTSNYVGIFFLSTGASWVNGPIGEQELCGGTGQKGRGLHQAQHAHHPRYGGTRLRASVRPWRQGSTPSLATMGLPRSVHLHGLDRATTE